MNSFSLSPSLRRIFLEALILCILAAAVGLSLNFKLIFNAFSGKSVVAVVTPGAVAPKIATDNTDTLDLFPMPIELVDLDELLSAGAVLVDARSFPSYEQAHLAGAVSLPFAHFDDHVAEFKQQFSPMQILITYCSGYGCPDSFDLGVRLMQEGYLDVLAYEGGLPEWRDAGRPLEGGGE